MDKRDIELQELVCLVSKFVDFANQLKDEGSITDEQYKYITKNKIEFLRETESYYIYNKENKTSENDLINMG